MKSGEKDKKKKKAQFECLMVLDNDSTIA